MLRDQVLAFDQTPFFNRSHSHTNTGYIFVPHSCLRNSTKINQTGLPLVLEPKCRLHANLHGCTMGADHS